MNNIVILGNFCKKNLHPYGKRKTTGYFYAKVRQKNYPTMPGVNYQAIQTVP
jgi:hypothetical protein